MLDPAYIQRRRASIDPNHATPSDQINPGHPKGGESTETTHFAVVDAEGNAVAVTYTLNGGFGSGVTAPGLGFLLNNEMDDFSVKPGEPNMFGLVQGETNAIQPGKRPLSSMTPTMVLRDGKLFMVVGAPGGSRIITAVMQVILNVIDFGMNAQDAVDYSALPSSMEAGQAISGKRIFAGHGGAAEGERARRGLLAGGSGGARGSDRDRRTAGCRAAATDADRARPRDTDKHS